MFNCYGNKRVNLSRHLQCNMNNETISTLRGVYVKKGYTIFGEFLLCAHEIFFVTKVCIHETLVECLFGSFFFCSFEIKRCSDLYIRLIEL